MKEENGKYIIEVEIFGKKYKEVFENKYEAIALQQQLLMIEKEIENDNNIATNSTRDY